MHIDVHTHFIYLDFTKHLGGRDSLPRSVLDGGSYFVECSPGFRLPTGPRITEMDTKLREIEKLDVDVSVLSLGVPGPEVLDAGEADDWASRINDHLAGIIEQYPGKFLGWGSIGFGDPARCIAEIDRCINELGFRGIQLFSNIRGRVLDSPEFRPIFHHMAQVGLPMNLHPTIPLNVNAMDSAQLVTGLAFMYDTTLATVRLLESGLFDEEPDFKLIMPHVGGVIPYLSGRLERMRREGARPLADYLAKLYFDTVTYHFEALEYCYNYVGARRLLFGTDHPFGEPPETIAHMIGRLDCTEEERELIFHGNAERLLKISPAV